MTECVFTPGLDRGIPRGSTPSPRRRGAYPPSAPEASLLSALFTALPEAVLVVDGAARVVLANSAAARLFGYTTADLPRQVLTRLVPDVATALVAGAPDPSSGDDVPFIGTARRRDDARFPAEIRRRVLVQSDGPLAVLSVRDATVRLEQGAQEQALRDCLERLQRVTDVALAHLQLDELLAALLDRIREALAADTAAILRVDPGPRRWSCGQEAACPRQSSRRNASFWARGLPAASRSPGSRMPSPTSTLIPRPNPYCMRPASVRSSGRPSLEEGRVLGVLHVGSRRVRHCSAEEVDLLRCMADRVALAVDNALLGTAPSDPATIAGYAAVLHEQLERSTGLIDQLLDSARIEHQRRELRSSTLDLAALAEEVIARFRYAPAPTSNHKLVHDAAALVRGRWDRDLLEQVLMNPVASALRYSPEGGEERVSVHLRAGSAEVRVEDPGIGITPDDLPHTGQPFILTARARQIAGGAGLGLYLSRQIVAVHQGRLVIDSAPDGRITVNVWLPPEADGAGPAELA